eukprot:gene6292-210_t
MSQKGTCCRWNAEKGFGFIKPADGSADVFCHRRELSADGRDRNVGLDEGKEVWFDVVTDDRSGKLRASNVS